MSNLKLVVDNRTSIKHHVLTNLMTGNGRPVSMFHAIRNIPDTVAAIEALKSLVTDQLVERTTVGPHRFVFYRYKAELNLYRRMEATQAV